MKANRASARTMQLLPLSIARQTRQTSARLTQYNRRSASVPSRHPEGETVRKPKRSPGPPDGRHVLTNRSLIGVE